MTMIYLQQTNRRQKRARKLIISICLFVALVVVANFFFPHILTPLTHTVARPLFNSRMATASGASSLWEFFHTKNKLAAENMALKEQVGYVRALETERNALAQEKAELEALLGRIGTSTIAAEAGLARLLSKPGFSAYDSVVLDAGSEAGVRKGALVYADHSIVLGEISEAHKTTSTGILYSSAGNRAEVLIGPQALQATAVGQGGGTIEIKLPQNTGVAVGDVVVLARDPGKIFGTVEKITTNPSDSFERLLFTSPVEVSKLKYVFIER